MRTRKLLVVVSLLYSFIIIAVLMYSNTINLTTTNTAEQVIEENQVNEQTLKLWPEDEPTSDRIIDQLLFAERLAKQTKNSKLKQKRIYLNHHWDFISHEFDSMFDGCPISSCQVTRSEEGNIDAYLFREEITRWRASDPKRKQQIWIYYSLESPRSYPLHPAIESINWTATYRLDSDIVTPYGKFVYKNSTISPQSEPRIKENYAKGKGRKVAWFVSNCHAKNNRYEFARELSKYIKVDIYGSCGRKYCGDQCFQRLRRDYKFYLSFENSNCHDYITEKFFVNALQHDVLPIVKGAFKEEYEKIAPPNSFIHIDQFEDAKSLAKYLHQLDSDDALYNSYFEWKRNGELINTRFWCRLCALLHSEYKSKYYKDLREWWNPNGICVNNDHL